VSAIRKLIEAAAQHGPTRALVTDAEVELTNLHRGGMSVSAEALSLQDEAKALRAEAAQLQRMVAQLTWERDRYRSVVDKVSVLDSVAVQCAAREVLK